MSLVPLLLLLPLALILVMAPLHAASWDDTSVSLLEEDVVPYYSGVLGRGGWQEWTGARSPVWNAPDELPVRPQEPEPEDEVRSYISRDYVAPTGGADITHVGEGTERVRAGLEGAWGGISSITSPVGGGVGGNEMGGRAGYETWTHEGGGLAGAVRASSIAIKPVADQYGTDGSLEQGNFPGVNPNDPDGTSWMIGMHRDGENTVGRWAIAPRTRLARKQQLLETGADVTDVGETTREDYVPGVYGPLSSGTSWVIGMHRKPMWSESQTYACSTTTPCKKGKADRAHFFQQDTNPYVDKRRVFDSYAQQDPDSVRGRDAYPWDPTLDPQIFRSTPNCADGKLRYGCFRQLSLSKDAPPIPEEETVKDMEQFAAEQAAKKDQPPLGDRSKWPMWSDESMANWPAWAKPPGSPDDETPWDQDLLNEDLLSEDSSSSSAGESSGAGQDSSSSSAGEGSGDLE
ncbi:hypothetical protein GUITHDRAFT_146646 [Guillardia theta CCMP2712]|uniref:Uncharacterized protein n=1 Tax=Guillardia theta (strain CCMP2712) TaxID=905079 RepID=L1IGM7_GUITC|nr:hypothetical protein GUITHDRAFT_146646 [Guillardia theta CCMP2712]EKX35237.1 hypothetical protein GUITHDRAFT_146646 [Guillardia theta CCMP2712]|eukprot:XP_005822217.1 hypothetical protein GUITHDRAFT_146646 [Guillardia theta CCMP2712]